MPRVGELLAGRYRIEAFLGAGGMATVHRATDLRLDRQVAVKVLLPNLAQDQALAERFDREARALAAVDHPAIVAIHDVEPGDRSTGREPFFVMELCDGGSLEDRLLAAGPMSPAEVVPLAVRIIEGLAALHGRGIVHRDVKPHNILLSASGPKLADFGIARFDSTLERQGLTATGTALATLGYAAPEILAGEGATAASDVYGLGGVVYKALTGKLSRPADTLTEAVDARLRPVDPLSSVAPDLGTAFDVALAAALSPEPARRPGTEAFAAGLTSALEQWTRNRPTEAIAVERSPSALVPARATKDPDAATVVVHSGESSPWAWGDRNRGTLSAAGRRRSVVVQRVGLVAVAGVALLLLAIVGFRLVSPGSPSLSSTESSTPTPSATPVASVVASASPAPINGGDGVGAQLDALREAIAGLQEEVARDLRERVDEVERSFAEDGADKAGEKARDLAKRIDELSREGKIGAEAADRLRTAARALLDALRAAPGDE